MLPVMETQSIYTIHQEVIIVGNIKSKIPELIAARGWDTRKFIAECYAAGLSQDTGASLASGATNFNDRTMRIVAGVLGVSSISELKDFENGKY